MPHFNIKRELVLIFFFKFVSHDTWINQTQTTFCSLKSWWAFVLKYLRLLNWARRTILQSHLSLCAFSLFCFCAWTLVKCWEIIVTSDDCLIFFKNTNTTEMWIHVTPEPTRPFSFPEHVPLCPTLFFWCLPPPWFLNTSMTTCQDLLQCCICSKQFEAGIKGRHEFCHDWSAWPDLEDPPALPQRHKRWFCVWIMWWLHSPSYSSPCNVI